MSHFVTSIVRLLKQMSTRSLIQHIRVNMRILIYRKYNKCRKLKIRTYYRKPYLESITPFKAFLNKTACELFQSFCMDITQSNVKTTIHLMIGSHRRTWLILRASTIFWESLKDAANIVLTDLHTHYTNKILNEWYIFGLWGTVTWIYKVVLDWSFSSFSRQ